MNTDKRTAGDLAQTYSAHIKGKVILTTGVSPGGIGAAFVTGIAQSQPSLLILAGRNPAKLNAVADSIKSTYPDVQIRTLTLDLASLSAVRTAAEEVIEWTDVPHIDVLVNNAAVMATDWSATAEGYDSQFVTNHLGPFLFSNLIMGKLLKSASPRIVNITSDGHRLSPIRFDDLNFRDGEYYHKWLSYGQSKTANMLMTLSIAEKLGKKHALGAFSVNPGLVATNLGGHLKLFGDSNADLLSMIEIDRMLGNAFGWMSWEGLYPCTPDVGANTYVYAAFDPDVVAHNGAYLQSCRLSDPYTDTVKSWATSSVDADRLWKLSEKLVGQEFMY